jgi:ketosteroid isomerase-like protein
MTLARFAAVMIAVALAASCTSITSKPTDEADVTAAIESFYAAMKKGDTKAAMAMIAPDAMFVESGRIETRQQYEENHLPLDIGFEKEITGKRSPWQIKINGDTAWGIASTTYDEGTFEGRDVNFVSRQLAVVTRGEDGKWLIRSIHWSSMPL